MISRFALNTRAGDENEDVDRHQIQTTRVTSGDRLRPSETANSDPSINAVATTTREVLRETRSVKKQNEKNRGDTVYWSGQ